LGKKSLTFGKNSLTYGKNPLTFGKKKIPPYFFAQYIISTWETIPDFREKIPIIRENSLTPEIPYF
jgi:hypothetical protein